MSKSHDVTSVELNVRTCRYSESSHMLCLPPLPCSYLKVQKLFPFKPLSGLLMANRAGSLLSISTTQITVAAALSIHMDEIKVSSK